jgi:hypothetical protein
MLQFNPSRNIGTLGQAPVSYNKKIIYLLTNFFKKKVVEQMLLLKTSLKYQSKRHKK